MADFDIMGIGPNGEAWAICRLCDQHPMNIAGINGGGYINPMTTAGQRPSVLINAN